MAAPEESDSKLLARIDERTKQLHDAVLAKGGMLDRVDSLESTRDRGTGVLVVIGVLWGALLAGTEAWFHHR